MCEREAGFYNAAGDLIVTRCVNTLRTPATWTDTHEYVLKEELMRLREILTT